jgi:hypothetical protein
MSPDRRIYIWVRHSADYIMRFITEHPIEWGDREIRRLHGPADQMGLPPSFAMAEFANFLNEFRRIPTQQEFIDFCYAQPGWAAWLVLKRPDGAAIYAHKLKGNFYPAAIDALHATALLQNVYDTVSMSTDDDARHGVDVEITHGLWTVKIDLKGVQTLNAQWTQEYRAQMRGSRPGVLAITLPGDFPQSPGNKRWFTVEWLRGHIDAELARQERV